MIIPLIPLNLANIVDISAYNIFMKIGAGGILFIAILYIICSLFILSYVEFTNNDFPEWDSKLDAITMLLIAIFFIIFILGVILNYIFK